MSIRFLRRTKPRAESADAPAPAYAELAVTTNFSFLRGGSHPEELVEHAVELGLAGLGIADRNTVAGVVRAHTAAHEEDADGNKMSKAQDRARRAARVRRRHAGHPRLSAGPRRLGPADALLTVGKSRADKAECILFVDDLLEHIEGLNLIVMPPETDRRRRSSARSAGAVCKAAVRRPSGLPRACSIAATMPAA